MRKAESTIRREITRLQALARFVEESQICDQSYGAAEALRWALGDIRTPPSEPFYSELFEPERRARRPKARKPAKRTRKRG